MIAELRHRPGELIQDRYEIVSVLGSGAFGTVYRCRDCELDVPVAIKELHVLDDPATGTHEREAALAQFRSEAIHLSHLRHPHIVSGHYQPHTATWLVCPVCGYSFRGTPTCPQHHATSLVLRQRHYLVMEYLDGPDLAKAATQAGGVLPIVAAVRYIRQIAEALQLIHARGWVHRDVKPENIRLRQTLDEAVLLDFGIATESGAAGEFSTRQMRHTTGGGTLGYAPETSQERRFPDARSDIHALGMTLYRLVSGRDPQESDDLVQMRSMRPQSFNSAISPALEGLILKAIDADPAQRHQNAAEFLKDISGILERSGDGAPFNPDPTTPRVARYVAPLPFRSGEAAGSLDELVRLMETYPGEAKEHLLSGDVAIWLENSGLDALAQRAREVCVQYEGRTDQALEAFLQATALVAAPKLQVSPTHLDFGTLTFGQRKTIPLELSNVGRGHLFGLVRPGSAGVTADREFDGNRAVVSVTARSRDLKPGRHHGDIVIDSSAGEIQVPFSLEVRSKTSLSTTTTVVFWAMIGMLCGQLLRTLPLLHQGRPPGWEWLNAASYLEEPLVSSMLFGLAAWGTLMLLAIAEATRRKSCAVFLAGTGVAALLGVLCALSGSQILVSGDVALQPYMLSLTHRWAAGGWMFVGGTLGACYGTLRRLRDVFSPRLLHVVYGWLIAMAIMYGILWIALIAVPAYH